MPMPLAQQCDKRLYCLGIINIERRGYRIEKYQKYKYCIDETPVYRDKDTYMVDVNGIQLGYDRKMFLEMFIPLFE
jgi:hypothetical protein